jgi:pimeloyl-ACP methyl ester carboxylesterase
LSAIADDLLQVRPESGQWDVAIGHSLGGAVVALGAHSDASWCRALALVDPALHVSDDDLDDILATHRLAIRHPPTVADVSSSHPDWSLEDVRLKVRAAGLVRHSAVDAILRVNRPWDVRLTLQSLKMPVHVISGDSRIFSMTPRGTLRALAQKNPLFSWTEVDGAGHSPHRERPDQTLRILDQFLGRVLP